MTEPQSCKIQRGQSRRALGLDIDVDAELVCAGAAVDTARRNDIRIVPADMGLHVAIVHEKAVRRVEPAPEVSGQQTLHPGVGRLLAAWGLLARPSIQISTDVACRNMLA